MIPGHPEAPEPSDRPAVTLPRNLTRKTFAVAGIAALVYVAAALVIGWEEIGAALGRLGAGRFAAVAALSLLNYALRFGRWHGFLAAVGVRLPWRRSLEVYFATYVMVITPGKIGEAFKAGMLRDVDGVPLSRGLPAVMAERVYDFLAVLVLVALGALFWRGPLQGAGLGLITGAGVVALLLLVRSARVRRMLLDRFARSRLLADRRVGLDDALAAMAVLLSPGRGLVHLLLSVAAWFCECAGMWLVCRELAPHVGLMASVFVYGAGTLIGSVSFLPGGIGGTEAVIVVLLETLAVARPEAAAIAFIVRLATLWLAVLVGLGFLAAARRRLFAASSSSSG
jgi:uncharacterized protein (TIRG00374 family)